MSSEKKRGAERTQKAVRDEDWSDDYKAENEYFIMRYADVLLMYAEAKIELGVVNEDLDLIQKELTKEQKGLLQKEKEAMKIQFSRLIEYLDFLPINVISIDRIEADDTIAYIAHTLLDEDVTILSADQDFLQLVDERITVWSPTKKKFYTPRMVMDDYGVPAHNFLMYKVLMGDKSDNIEGVKGLGPKKLPKIVPDLLTQTTLDLDFILEHAGKGEEPMHKKISESEIQLRLNEELMDLKNPPISGELKLQIARLIEAPINLLSRNDFIMMYSDDQLGNAIKAPDLWLREHFIKLNTLAKQTHE